MNIEHYSYIFIITAVITLYLSYLAFVNRNNKSNRSLSLLLVAVSIWSLFYGLELTAENYNQMYTFVCAEYVGIANIPVLWLLFVLVYSGRESWIKPLRLLLLLIIPLTTVSLVVTNADHHLFYKLSEILPTTKGYYHHFVPAVFYWIHIVYSYSVIFIGITIMALNVRSVTKEDKTRVSLIVLSSVIPYMFSLMYIANIRPEGNIDLTPIGFLIMGILLLSGTFNKDLLDIKPLVLESLFDSVLDAIIITDKDGKVLNINPIAESLFASGIISKNELLDLLKSEEYIRNLNNNSLYIELQLKHKTYRVQKTNIENHRGIYTGTMYLITDITREKEYRLALERSEEQYRLLFENAQEAIVVIQDRKIVFFNPMLQQLTGYSSEELSEMEINNLISSLDLRMLDDVYQKAKKGDVPENKPQFRLTNRNGSFCWVEFSAILIQWNGKQAGLLFVNNVNREKQAENMKELLIKISNTYINASVDQFDVIVNDSLREMGEFVNADRSYIFDYDWNNNVCSNTYEWCAEGISAEIDNLQNVPLEFLPDWVEIHKRNEPLVIDNLDLLPDTSRVKALLEPQGIKSLVVIPLNNQGNCEGFVGFDSVKIHHSFTEKEIVLLQLFSQMIVNLKNRRYSEQLINEQISVQHLINLVSSELVNINRDNIEEKIKLILKQTGEFFGVDRSYILRYNENSGFETNTHEWCAQNIDSQQDVIVNVDINDFPWWKSQVMKNEIIYVKDTSLLPDDCIIEKNEFRRQGIITLLCFPIIKNSQLIAYYGFDSVVKSKDWNSEQIAITETIANIIGDALIKVENENELIRSKQMAEAASVAKSNFLSNMSHEIRTPLNGVIGFTELLLNTPLSKIQKDYLDNTIISANSLLAVISDILDFSKIESGKMELESIKTDIVQLFENSMDIIKVSAAKKGLELLLNIHPDIPRFAYIDPIRTKQILVNLLSNAVKFTHTGEIELTLDFSSDDSGSASYLVSVRDSGIGIRNEDRDKLFKAFSQADTSTTRRYGGTGLGLIISNSLAQQMGSSISFESEFGKGSVFAFTIKCNYEFGNSYEEGIASKLKNVLVIDDNVHNLKILEHTFEHWKVACKLADSGEAALHLIKSGHQFDLVIVDYHMPQMDGLETIHQIRMATQHETEDLPVIMLHSSSDDSSLFENAKSLNVRHLLTKPVKNDELFYYLNSITDKKRTEIDEVTSDSDRLVIGTVEGDNYKILIVEDTPMNMIMIGSMLKAMIKGVEIHEAHNGSEAISQMHGFCPDLILMDVQMPEMDGLEATRQIRKLPYGLNVPVIALTAGVSKEEKEQCFTAGMDDFLSKPINKTDLFNIVSKYLKIDVSNQEKTRHSANGHASFDREKLLGKAGSLELMNTLLAMAKSEYPVYINEIKSVIDDENVDQIKLKAHKLKGSALNMEFGKLGNIAAEIEKSASDFTLNRQLLSRLIDEWKYLNSEIDL